MPTLPPDAGAGHEASGGRSASATSPQQCSIGDSDTDTDSTPESHTDLEYMYAFDNSTAGLRVQRPEARLQGADAEARREAEEPLEAPAQAPPRSPRRGSGKRHANDAAAPERPGVAAPKDEAEAPGEEPFGEAMAQPPSPTRSPRRCSGRRQAADAPSERTGAAGGPKQEADEPQEPALAPPASTARSPRRGSSRRHAADPPSERTRAAGGPKDEAEEPLGPQEPPALTPPLSSARSPRRGSGRRHADEDASRASRAQGIPTPMLRMGERSSGRRANATAVDRAGTPVPTGKAVRRQAARGEAGEERPSLAKGGAAPLFDTKALYRSRETGGIRHRGSDVHPASLFEPLPRRKGEGLAGGR